MLVSTCRLDREPDLRRAYVLHITNLEDRPLDYLLTFVLTVPVSLFGPAPPSGPELDQFVRFTSRSYSVEQTFRRMLVAEHRLFEPGVVYSAKWRVPIGGHQTMSVGIEPAALLSLSRLFGAVRTSALSELNHIEGYVTIRLPARRKRVGKFVTEPQSSGPVRVLLNPETRTHYHTGGQRMDIWDDAPPFPTLGGALLGQPYDPPPVKSGFSYVPPATIERTEPLHVATGKAENELLPEGAKSLTVESLNYALDAVSAEAGKIGDYRGSESVAEEDRAGALVELLLELGDDPALATAVNKVLEDRQASVRIRKP